MKKIEFTHEGVKYEADLAALLKMRLVKPVRQQITDIEVGDVFYDPNGRYSPLMVIETAYSYNKDTLMYNLAGRDGLRQYSNAFYHTNHRKNEILDHLNEKGMIKSGNINNKIYSLITESVAGSKQ